MRPYRAPERTIRATISDDVRQRPVLQEDRTWQNAGRGAVVSSQRRRDIGPQPREAHLTTALATLAVAALIAIALAVIHADREESALMSPRPRKKPRQGRGVVPHPPRRRQPRWSVKTQLRSRPRRPSRSRPLRRQRTHLPSIERLSRTRSRWTQSLTTHGPCRPGANRAEIWPMCSMTSMPMWRGLLSKKKALTRRAGNSLLTATTAAMPPAASAV